MRRLVIKNSYGLEIWQDIKGYEGKYQTSTLGRVKSLNYRRTGKEEILKPQPDRDGYLRVHLFIDGVSKDYYTHRLVAEAWLPSPQLDQSDVNHKDEDKHNNRVENLEYCTKAYNNNYGTHNQRVAEANINHPNKSKHVLQYNKEGNLIAEYPSTMEAERQTEIDNSHIGACCNGKRKSAGGFVWKYK